ncbi:MAG TPA: HAD-IA family hydrolase [Dehalococcoidia bacterium]|nr:HAD-IA family hydrolase [Dehalococcoidia bacterium]
MLLFDLGGVLVEFTGIEEMRRLHLRHLTDDQIRGRWAASRLISDFQLGRVPASRFGEEFVSEWALNINPADFLVQFESWTRRLYPGAAEMLKVLRSRHWLAALSNSNELHWRRNRETLGVQALFDNAFSSHEIGLLKPDPEAFKFILRELKVPAEEVTFFDDEDSNVEAARTLGIESYRVVGVQQLRSRLENMGLL